MRRVVLRLGRLRWQLQMLAGVVVVVVGVVVRCRRGGRGTVVLATVEDVVEVAPLGEGTEVRLAAAATG